MCALSYGAVATASTDYSFGSVSANHLDWTTSTEQTGKADNTFLEVEYGFGNSVGNFYGFVDFENLNDLDNFSTSAKVSGSFYTPFENVNIYTQMFAIASENFNTAQGVLGLQRTYQVKGLTISPFIGATYSWTDGGYSGANGGMFGWNAMYPFSLGSHNFTITNWNEIEFLRDSVYLKSGEKNDVGVNGAIALWYEVNKDFTVGVQYRYADAKLGFDDYSKGLVYSAKYTF